MSRKLVSIGERDALILHDALIARFGGREGLRDEALLQSALVRAPQRLAYGKNIDVIDMAAVYAAGLVGNHPFVDGNKRTGFLVGILFLELNGYRVTASEEEAAQAVLGLASGALDEFGYAAFLRAHARKTRP